MATVDMNRVIGRANLLFVTFDSLRFDVAALALDAGKTPEIGRWIGAGGWEKRESPGTFTLASHSAFFHGFLPLNSAPPQLFHSWGDPPPLLIILDNAGAGLHGLVSLRQGTRKHMRTCVHYFLIN